MTSSVSIDDALGVILDRDADIGLRIRAMLAREPREWQLPVGDILAGFERLVHTSRLSEEPAVDRRLRKSRPLTGLRRAVLLRASERGSLGLGWIALSEQVSRSAVVKAASSLEQAGLVRRITHSEDRRHRIIELTAAGARLADDVKQARYAALAAESRILQPDEVATLAAGARIAEMLADRMQRRLRLW